MEHLAEIDLIGLASGQLPAARDEVCRAHLVVPA